MKPYCFASTMCVLLSIAAVRPLAGADWPQFRGPDGSGTSSDANVAIQWSESENLKWRVPLPGPGSSSPIVWGQCVFVTCYSGYGASRTEPGKIEDLVRHLLCIDRSDGKVIWKRIVKAEMPEAVLRLRRIGRRQADLRQPARWCVRAGGQARV
jgi:hypothetical protein